MAINQRNEIIQQKPIRDRKEEKKGNICDEPIKRVTILEIFEIGIIRNMQ